MTPIEPEHWLERARAARQQAEQVNDPVSRQAMLRIADSYERMAARAREREVRHPPPTPRSDGAESR